MSNLMRELSAWLTSGRFVDLLSARYHAPYLTRHRLGAIDKRIRFVAAVFALLALVWIAFDVATLRSDHWPILATCRALIAVVFLRLVITPNPRQDRPDALAALAIRR